MSLTRRDGAEENPRWQILQHLVLRHAAFAGFTLADVKRVNHRRYRLYIL
jgi:hypothetical protein